uniref:Uncharacterized protein n=1 Tax=Panagrolaimus sp. PS1159 TaxID=55785 RepID=A0AC35FF49_9BILA
MQTWLFTSLHVFRYVALHILNEPVNLIFPSDKTFAQIAADIKVHSPIENQTCQDKTNTLKFKLAFDDNDKKYIRGEVKVVIVDQVEYVKMYLYEKCGRTEMSYATGTIEGAELSSENTGRLCFKNCDPFRQHGTNTGINVMELKISPGAFECQVFMILPQYVHVEDEKLPQYTKLPLNSSFDGHDEKFWWKSGNDSMLPDQISFDSSENVVINILNSTKDEPYFFRIGSGQPIPTFKFNLVQNNGFSVSTKITSNIDFKGLPSLVFGGKFVSVKVKTPLAIQSLEICELANEPDVPWDHFVLQISPIGDVLECEKAEIVMLNSDMINGAEVLIDRSKITESINATTESENNSTIASAVTSPKSFVESAEFPWWWIVVGGILYVLNLQVFFKIYFVRFKLIGIIAGIVVFIICIRRRRQQKKKLTPVESIVEDEEVGRITIETKTDVSPEKLSKEMKPKIVGKEKKEKPAKKKVPKEFADAKGNQKPAKLHSIQPSKQQQPPKREPPPPTILPKLLRNLKFRLMYGKDKETKLDEPFDYHENESSTFKPTEIPAKFVQPDLRVFTNFWDCVGEILTTKSVCQVYADNSNDKNTNVYFMVRDLVSNENYLPLRCLSNRMLEDFEPPQKKSPFVDEDGQQRIKIDSYYFLRVFILSYHPLTIEVH